MPYFSDRLSNTYYSGSPSYSSAHSYSASPLGMSYSASYLNPGGNFSKHSSLGSYTRAPITPRWSPTSRNYSPMLTTISERSTSSPSRILSPRRHPISKRSYQIATYTPRPIHINTADIDVSWDRYRSNATTSTPILQPRRTPTREYTPSTTTVKPTATSDDEPLEKTSSVQENTYSRKEQDNGPFMPRVDGKPETGIDSSPGHQRSTIKRGRTVVRLHTLKRKERSSSCKTDDDQNASDNPIDTKDLVNENQDSTKISQGWREKLSDELVYKDKREKKSLGEKLVEKFILKDDSEEDELKVKRESPKSSEPNSDHDSTLTTQKLTIPWSRSPDRRCSMEMLEEQANLLDSLIKSENLSMGSLDLTKVGVKMEEIDTRKSSNSIKRRKSTGRENPLQTTQSDYSLHDRMNSLRNSRNKHVSKRNSLLKSASSSSIGRLDSIVEFPKELPSLNLPIIEEASGSTGSTINMETSSKPKIKQKISGTVNISPPKSPLKFKVDSVTIEERSNSPKKEISYSSRVEETPAVKSALNNSPNARRKTLKRQDKVPSPEPEDGNFWDKIGKRETVYLMKRKRNIEDNIARMRREFFWFPDVGEGSSEEQKSENVDTSSNLQPSDLYKTLKDEKSIVQTIEPIAPNFVVNEDNKLNEPHKDNLQKDTVKEIKMNDVDNSNKTELDGVTKLKTEVNNSSKEINSIKIPLSNETSKDKQEKTSTSIKEILNKSDLKNEENTDNLDKTTKVITQDICKEIINSKIIVPEEIQKTSNNSDTLVKDEIHVNDTKSAGDLSLTISNDCLQAETQKSSEITTVPVSTSNVSNKLEETSDSNEKSDQIPKLKTSKGSTSKNSANKSKKQLKKLQSSKNVDNETNKKISTESKTDKVETQLCPSCGLVKDTESNEIIVPEINSDIKNNSEIKGLTSDIDESVNADKSSAIEVPKSLHKKEINNIPQVERNNIERNPNMNPVIKEITKSEENIDVANKPGEECAIKPSTRKPIKDEAALRPLIATPRPLQKKAPQIIHSSSSSSSSEEETSTEEEESEDSDASGDFFECETTPDGRTSTGSNDSGFDSSVPTSPAGFVQIKKDCDVNCHRKCEKLSANLCGVNQRLLVEALASRTASKKGGEPAAAATGVGHAADVAERELESSTAYSLFRKTGRFTPPARTIPRFRKYNVEDFHFIKVLGKGSFGKVLLAELRDTEYYYAVKCLKKDVVLEDDDVECTLIERKVLALGTNHPYLCHLFATFQTDSHLFFVMEYLNGGDLMFHIQQSGRFPEARARFYAAEIVSGLKFLHKRGIVYRDLKLDNILLDFEGHVRIADFGMCKLQIFLEKTADTFCGTPDYMAPEIIKGQKYNQTVDWWSFGVLLYEMLIGQSPFSGCDEDELFWSICNEMPSYPRFLSPEALSILTRLLDKDARCRLGGTECMHGDIRDQDFFRPVHWDRLERRELETPFRPKVRHPLDTQYFDKAFTGERARLTAVEAQVLRSMDQAPFRGFSYTNPNVTDR